MINLNHSNIWNPWVLCKIDDWWSDYRIKTHLSKLPPWNLLLITFIWASLSRYDQYTKIGRYLEYKYGFNLINFWVKHWSHDLSWCPLGLGPKGPFSPHWVQASGAQTHPSIFHTTMFLAPKIKGKFYIINGCSYIMGWPFTLTFIWNKIT